MESDAALLLELGPDSVTEVSGVGSIPFMPTSRLLRYSVTFFTLGSGLGVDFFFVNFFLLGLPRLGFPLEPTVGSESSPLFVDTRVLGESGSRLLARLLLPLALSSSSPRLLKAWGP